MPINYDNDYPKLLKLCHERGREIERLTDEYGDLRDENERRTADFTQIVKWNDRLQAKVEQLEVKAQDKEILRAFFEAVCDDNWEVANGIREALTGGAQALGGDDE